MLHDADDERILAVAQTVDVDLDGIGEVAVEQQWILAEHGVDLPGLVVRITRLDVGGHQLRQGAEQVVAELAFLANGLLRASGEVPRIGTLASSRACASFSGVWPPNCTITPSSLPLVHSVSMISSTSSAVSGSKYRRSAVS